MERKGRGRGGVLGAADCHQKSPGSAAVGGGGEESWGERDGVRERMGVSREVGEPETGNQVAGGARWLPDRRRWESRNDGRPRSDLGEGWVGGLWSWGRRGSVRRWRRERGAGGEGAASRERRWRGGRGRDREELRRIWKGRGGEGKRGRDKVRGASRVGHAWAVRDEHAGGNRLRVRLVSRFRHFGD